MIPKMTITDASQFLDITPQGVMKKIKNLKLPYCKSQNRIYFGYETSKELFNILIKPKILAFQIVKGGTGKSNISLNFAIRANLYGLKVLCIDLDQQANLTTLFDIDAQGLTIMHDIILSNGKKKIEDNLVKISEGLHLFPSSLENAALDDEILVRGLGIDRVYKDIFEPLREYYDLIIIDCPPALGRSVGAAACAADEVIAPVIPDKLCLRGLQLLEDSLKELEEKKIEATRQAWKINQATASNLNNTSYTYAQMTSAHEQLNPHDTITMHVTDKSMLETMETWAPKHGNV